MIHFDKAIIKQDTVHTTDEGFLKGSAVVTRTGIFTYGNSDGTKTRELRLPEDVFHKDSLQTIQGIPVTIDHPPVFVNSRNSDEFSVGFTGEQVTIDGNQLIINFTITDQAAVNTVKNGKQALSLGYEVDLEIGEGIHKGDQFDAIQRNLKYNHLAVVDNARAGKDARIKLDGGEYAVQINDDININKGKTMKFKLNGVEYDVSDDVGNAMLKQQKADEDTLKAAKAEASKQKARGDTAAENLHKAQTQEKARVDAETRTVLVENSKKILPEDYKFDDRTDREIKCDTILVHSPDVKLDDQDEAYIQARYDLALEVTTTNNDGIVKQKGQMTPKLNKDGVPVIIQKSSGRRDGFEELTGIKEDAVEDARRKFDTIYCRAHTIPNVFKGKPKTNSVYKRIVEGVE